MIYSATQQIVQSFKESEEQINGYAFEKLTTAQWHINAAVGDNGYDVNFHVIGGLGCAVIFREELEKQFKL